MKPRQTSRCVWGLVLVLLGGPASAWHYSYLLDGDEEYVFSMPVGSFHYELGRILGPPPEDSAQEAQPHNPAYPDYSGHVGYFERPEKVWERTLQHDGDSLREALETAGATPPAAVAERVERYLAMRKVMREDPRRRGSAAAPASGDAVLAAPDFAPYEDLLASLPHEFALYARGAAALHMRRYLEAAELARALLALAPEERVYRSTWAAYLLGRAQMEVDPGQALTAFEHVRTLAREGFADPLDLAGESVGMQALAEMKAGRLVEAAHRWASLYPSPLDSDHHTGYSSLRVFCKTLFAEGDLPPELARDPLCRQILSAWVNSQGHGEWSRAWVRAVREAQVPDLTVGAEGLAWAALDADDLDAAEEWASLAPENPFALWVRAKLRLREGDRDAGIALFRQVVETMPADTGWVASYPYSGRLDPREEALAQLGTLLLSRGDYTEALSAFLQTHRYDQDAYYIAERVLTVEELQQFADAPPEAIVPRTFRGEGAAEDIGADPWGLRALLARRLARQGNWLEAAPHYHPARIPAWRTRYGRDLPPGTLSDWARQVGHHIAGAEETKLSARKRAVHYFEAGVLLRSAGYSLLFAAIAPGYEANEDGLLPCRNREVRDVSEYEYIDEANARQVRLAQEVGPSADELERVRRHAPQPAKRHFDRYIVAECFKKCADLLPRNDELAARALYLAGFELRYIDPAAADVYYKQLVRRCGKTPLGREADRLRWFPPFSPEYATAP